MTATHRARRRPRCRRLPALLLALAAILSASDPGVMRAEAQEKRQDSEITARGRYLLHAGGCVTCHTAEAEDAVPLAGGRALETPFGTFHTPNLTPDPGTGLGTWSAADFRRALQHGEAPDGSPYYPAFPYLSYAGISDRDADALFAYLQSLEPVERPTRDHALDFPYGLRWGLWPWRWLYFEAGPFVPDPQRSDSWNRGAYLVENLGHCGECHTPRNLAGAPLEERRLAGTAEGPDGKAVPNITPHAEDGIGGWDETDVSFFLESGFLPDGDVAGGAMTAVIEDSTGQLTAEDRAAIAEYLLSLPPLPD